MDDSVTIICYGGKEVWPSRQAAMDFYAEGVFVCDGAERERYINVLLDLYAGLKICTDGR